MPNPANFTNLRQETYYSLLDLTQILQELAGESGDNTATISADFKTAVNALSQLLDPEVLRSEEQESDFVVLADQNGLILRQLNQLRHHSAKLSKPGDETDELGLKTTLDLLLEQLKRIQREGINYFHNFIKLWRDDCDRHCRALASANAVNELNETAKARLLTILTPLKEQLDSWCVELNKDPNTLNEYLPLVLQTLKAYPEQITALKKSVSTASRTNSFDSATTETNFGIEEETGDYQRVDPQKPITSQLYQPVEAEEEENDSEKLIESIPQPEFRKPANASSLNFKPYDGANLFRGSSVRVADDAAPKMQLVRDANGLIRGMAAVIATQTPEQLEAYYDRLLDEFVMLERKADANHIPLKAQAMLGTQVENKKPSQVTSPTSYAPFAFFNELLQEARRRFSTGSVPTETTQKMQQQKNSMT